MPVLQVNYVDRGDLCQALTTILNRLQCSEDLPDDQELLLRLRSSSSALPNVSITEPGVPPTEPLAPSPTGRTLTFDEAVALTRAMLLADRGTRDSGTIEDPFAGPNPPPTDEFIEDLKNAKGLDPKVAKGVNAVFEGLVMTIDRIFPRGPSGVTATDNLAAHADISRPTARVRLAAPLLGNKDVGHNAVTALKNEADRELLERDPFSLRLMLDELDKQLIEQTQAKGRPTLPGRRLTPQLDVLSRRQFAEVRDRISGDLEILRIEQQERL